MNIRPAHKRALVTSGNSGIVIAKRKITPSYVPYWFIRIITFLLQLGNYPAAWRLKASKDVWGNHGPVALIFFLSFRVCSQDLAVHLEGQHLDALAQLISDFG